MSYYSSRKDKEHTEENKVNQTASVPLSQLLKIPPHSPTQTGYGPPV